MEKFVNLILTLTLLDVTKWMLIVGLVMYCVFGVVIVRQVKVMNEAFESELNTWFQIFSWLHLLMSIFLLLLAIVIL
ncbi:MAG: DUF5657 family protein [Patescibacteria group bacterium]